MSLFTKLAKWNPNTILGKAIETFKKEIGPLSFLVYFAPIIVLCMTFIYNNPDASIPSIYTILMGWYFVSLYLVDKIKSNNKLSEIIEMIICLPVYLSVIVAYFIIRLFFNKKKYPNITEDKLPLHQRKFKLKKLKKKIKRKRIFG